MELEEWQQWWRSRGSQGLRDLLMAHWDPIGVTGVPDAWDEYDSYMGPLARKLREGAGPDAVAAYLAEIESEQMEIPATPDKLLDPASRIADWYAAEMASAPGDG